MSPIRVLLADDHPLIRSGLRSLLDAQRDIAVTGEASSYTELWEVIERDAPDVVLLDLRMPGGVGLDAVKRLRRLHPSVKVLVLSSFPEEAFMLRMIAAGAAGYLQKDGPAERIANAIRTVAAGDMYVSETGARTLARAARPGAARLDSTSLSDREFEVMRLLGAGVSNNEIADRLSISIKTVSTYRTRLMEKMGFTTTADIIRYAVENGLID